MQCYILLCLIGTALASTQGRFIFDLLKSPLTSEEVAIVLNSKDASPFPTLVDVPVNLKFDCSQQKYSGFYADVTTQCQVYHRCELNGNRTSFICTNTTVFNQLTLVCDYWYNVDCERSPEFADFANSRLYTSQQLFDSPPKDYVSPYQQAAINKVAQDVEYISEIVDAAKKKAGRT